jgi:hypothetical protein
VGGHKQAGTRRSADATVLKGAINKSDPNVFDISLVTPTGEEKETLWLPEGTPEEDVMDENRTAYRTFERPLQRGSSISWTRSVLQRRS